MPDAPNTNPSALSALLDAVDALLPDVSSAKLTALREARDRVAPRAKPTGLEFADWRMTPQGTLASLTIPAGVVASVLQSASEQERNLLVAAPRLLRYALAEELFARGGDMTNASDRWRDLTGSPEFVTAPAKLAQLRDAALQAVRGEKEATR